MEIKDNQAFFWQNFSQNWGKFYAKLRKNRKTEKYEIFRPLKLVFLPRNRTIMDIFCDKIAKFLKTWAKISKTEKFLPKLSSKNAKTAIYEIFRPLMGLKTCQKSLSEYALLDMRKVSLIMHIELWWSGHFIK